MLQCTGCGNELPVDAAFCPRCALRVAAPAAAEAAVLETISNIRTITGPDTSAAAGLADGTVFHERYRIERNLGAGAMGVVYAALDQVTNRTVALKLINPALADRPSAREKFIREGLMARDIRHANIVAMYDVGEANGQVYLVMEYLAGETLRKWLRRTLQEGRDISFEEARGIVRNVLEGLVAAHATGVVHRDLKPENIMLTGEPHAGQYGLKILDFGIARAVGAGANLLTTSASTGTPLYMAPEQKTAADTVGPPADLYAVTAVFCELLLGVAPEGRGVAPSRERCDLPPGVDAVIETGLANRPRSRYQSAAKYIEALDAIAPGTIAPQIPRPDPLPSPQPEPRPTPIVPPEKPARLSIGARWRALSKRQRYLAIAIGVVVLGLIGRGLNPPAAEDMSIAGRWSDSFPGSSASLGYVDFAQQGRDVTGSIYNPYGALIGTLTGRVQGTSLEYRYLAANGMTGSVRADLQADGMHMDLTARNDATGQSEQHLLHRNHAPHQ
jgi:serine/threonine protein kinase